MPSEVNGFVVQCQDRNPLQRPDFPSLLTAMQQLQVQSVGAAFVRKGQEGRRQDRVLQQVCDDMN
jgi:hypothetical protein